jgi:hypothetical protein
METENPDVVVTCEDVLVNETRGSEYNVTTTIIAINATTPMTIANKIVLDLRPKNLLGVFEGEEGREYEAACSFGFPSLLTLNGSPQLEQNKLAPSLASPHVGH